MPSLPLLTPPPATRRRSPPCPRGWPAAARPSRRTRSTRGTSAGRPRCTSPPSAETPSWSRSSSASAPTSTSRTLPVRFYFDIGVVCSSPCRSGVSTRCRCVGRSVTVMLLFGRGTYCYEHTDGNNSDVYCCFSFFWLLW